MNRLLPLAFIFFLIAPELRAECVTLSLSCDLTMRDRVVDSTDCRTGTFRFDEYAFWGEEGALLSLEIRSGSGQPLTYQMINAAGAVIDEETDTVSGYFDDLPYSGFYRVRVGTTASFSVPYDFFVRCPGLDCVSSGTASCGFFNQGVLTAFDCTVGGSLPDDYYLINLAVGESVSVEVSPADFEGLIDVYHVDVGSGGWRSISNGALKFTAMEAGDHWIRVQAAQGHSGGFYSVTVQCIDEPGGRCRGVRHR